MAVAGRPPRQGMAQDYGACGGLMKIMFMDNGTTVVFSEGGNQMPDLQESWLLMYTRFLESKGFDPMEHQFELPSGRHAKIIRRIKNGFTWQIND